MTEQEAIRAVGLMPDRAELATCGGSIAQKVAQKTSDLERHSFEIFPWISQGEERRAWIARQLERQAELLSLERVAEIEAGGRTASGEKSCRILTFGDRNSNLTISERREGQLWVIDSWTIYPGY
jgi:hypothetical protein